MPRVSPAVLLTPEQRSLLENLVCSQETPPRIRERARILLGCAVEGYRADLLAKSLGVHVTTVYKWRDRFLETGECDIPGLGDLARSGRPVVYGPEYKERILKKLGETPPDGCAFWETATLARELDLPVSVVVRLLARFGICLKKQDPEQDPEQDFTKRRQSS